MADLIDRQAAIDVLCDNCDNAQAVCPHYPCKQYTAIDALPSVQPQASGMICGSCKDSDSNPLYTTARVKCQRSGELRFVTDYCNLPPAQPRPIRINLNEPIKVKLTDWGKEIYYRQYNRVNQIAGREICKPNFPKEDENGYTKFQLWDFMNMYGQYISMGAPNVIEPLELVYEGREE